MKTGAADEQLIRRAGFCVKQGSGIVRYYKKYVIFYMGTDSGPMVYSIQLNKAIRRDQKHLVKQRKGEKFMKKKRILSLGLGLAMLVTTLGVPSMPAKAELQAGLADTAREAAAEGIVMLKNDNQVLPLGGGTSVEKVSVFGRVQIDYFPCGYGSGGDVKVPYTVNLLEGLRDNPAIQVNEELAAVYEKWCGEHVPSAGGWGNWPLSHPEMPLDDEVVADAAEYSDTAVVVIGRSSGEDRESRLEPGSWYLTDLEKDMLAKANDNFENVVVLLNVGTLIDMSWVSDYDNLDSILYVWQGGMESGNAVADVLSGSVAPSGKLPQTIADSYEDYPSAANFGNTEYNNYAEDIYVGYRYFETFAKDSVMYPFGYGLGYTDFAIDTKDVTESDGSISVDVTVTNTGDTYSGKEVVQVYYGAPQGELGKAEKSLAAYAKTNELAPGEQQDITLTFKADQMASYDDAGKTGHKSAYVMEAGEYPIYVGNSVRDAKEVGVYTEPELRVTEQCTEANAVEQGFDRMVNNNGVLEYEPVPTATVDLHDRIESELPAAVESDVEDVITLNDVYDGTYTLDQFVAQLDFDDLEALTRGDYTMGSSLGAPGNAAVYGGITESLREKGVVPVTTTDGPSGIRLTASASLVPIGTCLSSTWNDDLVEELYQLVGQEMVLNGSDVILAPGMNLQRDPLCGRNFEYFSEDPLLTGRMGANYVKGVQSQGVSACPKHFALNNQETNRNYNDSRCSERAQRELYLKGFEICIKEAKPLNLMTSYNKVNGEWAYYNYELMKTILRDEWGYEGVLMTDWWIREGTCDYMEHTWNNAYRVRANTDLLMPGEGPYGSGNADQSLRESYENWVSSGSPEGTVDSGITLGELQRTAKRVLTFVMKSENFRTTNGLPTYAEEYAGTTGDWFAVDTVKAPEKPVLSGIRIDGENLNIFSPLKKEYKIFTRDLSRMPEVSAESDEGEVEITQATAESGCAVIRVANDNGATIYRIYFTNEADLDPVGENPVYAKVNSISVNGEEIYNFYPTIKSYTVKVESAADTEITAETPENVSASVTMCDGYAVVRAESDDQATEYKVYLDEIPSEELRPHSDDFAGSELKDFWTLNDPDETHFEKGDGYVQITSQVGQFYQTSEDNYVKNYLSQPAYGDWEAVATLNFEVEGGQAYQQFGLLVMDDPDNYVGVKYECNDWNSGNWEGVVNVQETNGTASSDTPNMELLRPYTNDGQAHDFYYKIRKEGDTFKLSFSVNGTDFVDMGTKTMALNDPKLVIYAANGMGSLKDGTSTADVTETPVIVKDLQVTDLNSAGQPEVQVTTIKASQPGDVTKMKATSNIYKYGSQFTTEASQDPEDPEGAAGMIVGTVKTGNYLLFKVNVEKSGRYLLAPRTAALDESGNIQYSYQLECDGDVLASFVHGHTGGWWNWVTQEAKEIYLTEGQHTLRLYFNCSDININYFQFTYAPEEEPEETLNTDVLEYALELAASADTEGVVPAVADRFNAAVANGQAILDRVYAGDYTVTQAMVDQSWSDIITMMQYLSFKQGDKSDLEAVIRMAEGLDLSKYIESTLDGFEEALTAANDVYADENAMQGDVDQAWRTLLKEMSEMRLTPDKDALAALIQSASGLNESAYEAESFALMRTALAAAEDIYADENATEEEVQTAVSDLQSALAALVKAAPAADDTTAAEDNNTAETDSKDIDGTLTAGVTSSNNTSGSSTAGTKTAGTTSVKTGDTVNTAAMAVMIGALAVIGLAATTIVSRKRR